MGALGQIERPARVADRSPARARRVRDHDAAQRSALDGAARNRQAAPVSDVEQLSGRPAERDAGAVLGAAFVEDPVWAWVLRGADRERRLALVFGAFAATAARTQGGLVLVTPERSAAAVWLPPGHWQGGLRETARQLPTAGRALGAGVVRALRLQAVVERLHPREPHWYLEALGALPAARGTGVGPRVVQPVLDRCDDDGVPAYLESSNPRNWTFYRRLGFVSGDPLPVPAGCPVVLPMTRRPR